MTTKERFKEVLDKIYKPEVCEKLFANLDREGLNWNHPNSEEDLSWILGSKLTWSQTPEGYNFWADIHHVLWYLEQKNRTQ